MKEQEVLSCEGRYRRAESLSRAKSGWLPHLGSRSLVPRPTCAQGTSRGGANVKEIVRRIDLWGLNMVFVVGGNGGNAAAHAISEECQAQGVVCSVVGVPKSIDNDILLVREGRAGEGRGGGHYLPIHLRGWRSPAAGATSPLANPVLLGFSMDALDRPPSVQAVMPLGLSGA